MKKHLLASFTVFLVCCGLVFTVVGVVRASSDKASVEKRYWVNSSSSTIQKNTFNPGDNVVVSISVSATDELSGNIDIVDRLPSKAVPVTSANNLKDETKCHVPLVEEDNFSLSSTDSSEIRWSDIAVSASPKYFCYQFTVDSNVEAKNIVEQAQVKVVRKTDSVVIGNENNLVMTVGSIWADSLSLVGAVETPGVDGKVPSIETSIDDELVKEEAAIKTKDGVAQDKTPSFLYKTSSGQNTRGGLLGSYPVSITDKTGNIVLGSESSYIFYNPLYYVFGNVFSGGSSTSRAFDYNSNNSSIASKDGDTNKLNDEATLYNYNFDEDSLIYWDRTNADKNEQMYQNINKYISSPKPSIVCDMKSLGLSKASFSNVFYTKNKDCNPSGVTYSSDLYPNGRIWYYKAEPSVDGNEITLNTHFIGTGTIIFDFSAYGSGSTPVVNVKKIGASYSDYLGSLGLIVINGGNVSLADSLQRYAGIIFVPGSQSGSGGEINFVQGGKSLTINGSLVADKIVFNTRQKNNKGYGAMIYSNSKILASLPGFEAISSVLFK